MYLWCDQLSSFCFSYLHRVASQQMLVISFQAALWKHPNQPPPKNELLPPSPQPAPPQDHRNRTRCVWIFFKALFFFVNKLCLYKYNTWHCVIVSTFHRIRLRGKLWKQWVILYDCNETITFFFLSIESETTSAEARQADDRKHSVEGTALHWYMCVCVCVCILGNVCILCALYQHVVTNKCFFLSQIDTGRGQ